jgi:hypothetical protein
MKNMLISLLISMIAMVILMLITEYEFLIGFLTSAAYYNMFYFLKGRDN